MIDFKPLTPEIRDQYQAMRRIAPTKGCEYSFNSLFLWGNQQIAFRHGCALIYSEFEGFRLYPYPVGDGDKKAAIQDLMTDAEERGIPFRLSGLDARDKEELETLFPGMFLIEDYRNGADYVYQASALANLAGRKLHKKKNHVNQFAAAHPGWYTRELLEEDLPLAKAFVRDWYAAKEAENPEADYDMEKAAFRRAFDHFHALQMQGLFLMEGEEILAFTMGSLLYCDTFDTHFEKAREGVNGAYAMINREFARHLLSIYPNLKYIDREDDMGLPGLRQAKLSYHPDHLIEKGFAVLASQGFPEEEEAEEETANGEETASASDHLLSSAPMEA